MKIDTIRSVRQIYDMYDVLNMDRRKVKIVCPLPAHNHSNNTPSFAIFRGADGVQRFQCHGNCGLHGDVLDLVGYLHIAGYNDKDPRHITQAAALLGSTQPIRVPEPIERTPTLNPGAMNQYLPLEQEVIEYAFNRGLVHATLLRFSIGQRGHYMAIPIYEDYSLKAIKFRNIKTGGLRFFSEKGSVKALWNYDGVLYTNKPVLIVKGEIPGLLMEQEGFTSCAISGGESSDMQKYRDILSFSAKLVYVGDNDRDPAVREKMQQAARKRADMLGAELRFPPDKFKDIDDWYLGDPQARSIIRSWLE